MAGVTFINHTHFAMRTEELAAHINEFEELTWMLSAIYQYDFGSAVDVVG